MCKPQLWPTVRRNSPGIGAKKIIAPAAQRGQHIDLQPLLYCCVFVWEHRQCVCVCVHTCMCLHPFVRTLFPPCSISPPHKSAHVRGRALLLSNWWSIQIKMKLHHTNRGSGEQSAGSLQSAGKAGELSLLSSGLLSLNPVAALPVRSKPTGHTEFNCGTSWISAGVSVREPWCAANTTTDD